MIKVAILGDRDGRNANHQATESALQHSAGQLGVRVDASWFATDALLKDAAVEQVEASHGVWCTTGSPYRSFEGALRGIRLAREHGIPLLGTCGGFQHAVLELARNVLGFADAAHAEYEGSPTDSLIAALECSLAGKWFDVQIDPDSRVADCYGSTEAREQFYCSYGINPRFQERLAARGLPIVGRADDGTPRILELAEHPFFVATLFVPQARSTAEVPHLLVTGFLRAAAEMTDESSRSAVKVPGGSPAPGTPRG